jgi:Icc-related predicted phosphoesterase
LIRMDIVGLADIHGDVRAVRKVGPDLRSAHAVLLIGDITHFGRAKEAAAIVDALAAFNPRILAVPGNCDHPEVSEYLAQRGVSLDGRRMIVDGVAFVGVGASLPCPGGATPNEIGEQRFARALENAAGPLPAGVPMILVSHQPPYDTKADGVAGGRHVGSTSVRQFIRDRQPLLCFTGHIHEGRGIDTIGVCQVINPGPLREGRYAWAALGQTVAGPAVMDCEIRKV